MKTLQDVTQETGISYYTLVKYTGLGLVPKPQRVWRGRKGSESLYPDNTIYLINMIIKQKESGLTLRQIAENRRIEREKIFCMQGNALPIPCIYKLEFYSVSKLLIT